MLILLSSKATDDQIRQASEDLDGYIKFVVDIEKKVLTIGGTKHVDGEKLLLDSGSSQRNLWGGGYDTQTKEIDFDSMINIRPTDNNPNRTVQSRTLQKEIEKIVRSHLE